MKSYIIFIVCAILSAHGCYLFLNVGGFAKIVGIYLFVILGLSAIVFPILLELKKKG